MAAERLARFLLHAIRRERRGSHTVLRCIRRHGLGRESVTVIYRKSGRGGRRWWCMMLHGCSRSNFDFRLFHLPTKPIGFSLGFRSKSLGVIELRLCFH